MDLRSVDAFAVAAALFMFAAISVFQGNSAAFSENAFVQAAGFILWLPMSFIAQAFSAGFTFIAPLALLALLFHINAVRNAFGESVLAAAVFAAVVLAVGA